MYEMKPKRQNRSSGAIAFALFGGAALTLAFPRLPGVYPGLMQSVAFALVLAGLLICTRYLLTSYSYSVGAEATGAGAGGIGTEGAENDGYGAAPDRRAVVLTVSETRGRRTRTVCRLPVAGGMLIRLPAKGAHAVISEIKRGIMPGSAKKNTNGNGNGNGNESVSPNAKRTLYNYCPDAVPTLSYIFIPAPTAPYITDASGVADTGEAVRFCPDDVFVTRLIAAGAVSVDLTDKA